MQWSDAITPPSPRMLRQFAVLWLVVFAGLASWRAWSGTVDAWTVGLALAAVLVGGAGLASPVSIRWIYSGWMILAFPIGWTVTQVVLAVTYFGLFMPIAAVFRLMGRDALVIRRRGSGPTYWAKKPSASTPSDYLREY